MSPEVETHIDLSEREMADPYAESRETLNLQPAEKILQDYLLTSPGVERANLGASFAGYMGKALFRSEISQADVDRIRLFMNKYEKIMGPWQFNQLRSGYLAEVATRYALAELNLDIANTTPKEDVQDKIDLWLDLSSETLQRPERTAVMVQVKALPLANPQWFMRPVTSDKDLHQIADQLYALENWRTNPNERRDFERRIQEANLQKDKFIHNTARMLNYSRQFGNTEAAIVTLPSFGQENSQINEITGKPVKSPGQSQSWLSQKIGKDLQEFYLKT